MKIIFELDDGAYVLEIVPQRLYAKIEKHTDIPKYSATVSPLLKQGHFKEYRDSQPDFEEMMYGLIRTDLRDVLMTKKQKTPKKQEMFESLSE